MNKTERRKILVVDDEKVITDLAKTYLEQYGFDVVCAYDGEEALDLVTSEKPDLILLDVILPKIDGIEVCKRLKEQSEYQSIPILMLTAKGLNRDIEKGHEVGADEYIVKPFSGKALIVKIKEHLKI